MRFFLMSQGSFNPKIRFQGQKVCSVAWLQTDRQIHTKVITEGTLSGFQEFFLQPIIKDRPNKMSTTKMRFFLIQQKHRFSVLRPKCVLFSPRTHTQRHSFMMFSFNISSKIGPIINRSREKEKWQLFFGPS